MNREAILRSTHDLRERYMLGDRASLVAGANKHLHRGFIVRLYMIENSAVELEQNLPKQRGPLPIKLALELTAHLNLLYLNIAASLDNLAWALAYQYALLPNLDEEDRGCRRFVGLMNPRFQEKLHQVNQGDLADALASFADWYRELRDFRDPAAHRIPLSVPHSVYSSADVVERKNLDQDAAKHFAEDEHELGMEKIFQMAGLGTYFPAFIAETENIAVYSLGPKVTEDIGSWYKISEVVFVAGFQLQARGK